MANFDVVEGELVPIDVNGNPLPIQNGGTIGTTPGMIVAAKEGTVARFLEARKRGNERALTVGFPEYYETSFGELKVAAPYSLADLNFKYEIDTRVWGTSTATGGTVTYNTNQATAQLTVTGTSGSTAILSTHTYFRYQSGKALTMAFTCYHSNAGNSNQARRWGIFDANDGLFFELSGTTLQLVRRSSTSGSPVNTTYARGTWLDPLDGSGPSGVTLSLTNANIYEVHYQWLGAGTVSFFVNGILVYKLENANTLAVPYMRTGQLPVRAEVVNTGASTAANMQVICTSVKALGGDDPPEYPYGARNTTDITVGATEIPLLSIRPKLVYPTGGTQENRMLILPKKASIKTEGTRAGWSIYMNPTLTGPSWTSVDAKSGVEFDVSATAFSGGELIYNGFLPDSNTGDSVDLDTLFTVLGRKLRRDAFLAQSDILTITGYREGAGSTNMRAYTTWSEVRLWPVFFLETRRSSTLLLGLTSRS